MSAGPVSSFTNWSLTDFTADIGWTFSNENRTFRHTGGQISGIRSTRNDLTTGKHYWEITVTEQASASDGFYGISETGTGLTPGPSVVGPGGGPWAVWRLNGSYEGSSLGPGPSVAGTAVGINTGSLPEVLMFALDLDNGSFWMGLNGVWNTAGADPATNTNPCFDTFPNLGVTQWAAYFVSDNQNGAQESTANFGNEAFIYTVPAGFTAGIAA